MMTDQGWFAMYANKDRAFKLEKIHTYSLQREDAIKSVGNDKNYVLHGKFIKDDYFWSIDIRSSNV